MRRISPALLARCAAIFLPLALAACNANQGLEAETTAALGGKAADAQSSSQVTLAKRHFRDQNYGLAEEFYRKAVAENPGDAEAWMGLAAAYDQLRRFNEADKAYAEAEKLAGRNSAILNNRGYSYLLRGDRKKALADLNEAQQKDPGNQQIANNLKLARK